MDRTQTGLRYPCVERLERASVPTLREARAPGMHHNASGKNSEVEPPFIGRHIGDVTGPLLVDPGGSEVTSEYVLFSAV